MRRLEKTSRARQAADAIEEALLLGEFARGARLPSEEALAERLNTSRSTVREAVSRLTARGLLVAVHGVGTFVQDLDVARSVEALPALYRLTPTRRRRIQLTREFFDLRRMVMKELLPIAAERGIPDRLAFARDKFVCSMAAAEQGGLQEAVSLELEGLRLAAEASSSLTLRLLTNTLLEFAREAGADITVGIDPARWASREEWLDEFLGRGGTADDLRAFVETYVYEEDKRVLLELESRLRAPRASQPVAQPGVEVHATDAGGEAPSVETTDTSPAPPQEGGTPGGIGVFRVTPGSYEGGRPAPAIAICHECGQPVHVPGLPDTDAPEPQVGPEASAPPQPPPSADSGDSIVTPPPVANPSPPQAPVRGLPRSDPRSWNPSFIAYCQRNFGENPWDDPDQEPPGPDLSWITRGT